MKQYQRHVEIATKLADAGNYNLAIKNIDALIRSARSLDAIAYLNNVISLFALDRKYGKRKTSSAD